MAKLTLKEVKGRDALRPPDMEHRIEGMTDEEIIEAFPYPKSAEILLERYNDYLWRMAERAWQKAIGREYVPLEDLFAAAKLGLVVAVKTFKPETGVKFITYMVKVVNNHIIHEIKSYMPINVGWLDKLSDDRKQEIAHALADMASLDDSPFTSAGGEKDDREPPLSEIVADSKSEKEIEDIVKRWQIEQALRNLNPVERQVISLIYGLNGGEPRTVKDVSATLGYKEMQIRYIHKRALKKLKGLLA